MLDCPISCGACSLKRQRETKKPEDSDDFSEVEHKHQNPVAVLNMQAITSLLYMFQRSMQANRKIHLCLQKSTRLHVVSQQSTKMQQI